MAKDIKDFRVTDCTYHRNGVGGRPFWVVRFSCIFTDFSPNRFMPNMLAIVPSLPHTDVECSVLDLNDPTQKWRGDHFAPLVKAAIEESSGSPEW